MKEKMFNPDEKHVETFGDISSSDFGSECAKENEAGTENFDSMESGGSKAPSIENADGFYSDDFAEPYSNVDEQAAVSTVDGQDEIEDADKVEMSNTGFEIDF